MDPPKIADTSADGAALEAPAALVSAIWEAQIAPRSPQIADTSAVGDPRGDPTALVSVIWEQKSLQNPPES